MSYSITITGLDEVRKALGTSFRPAIDTGLKTLAGEVQNEIAPYPRATVANSPSSPTGRWYERGYGPKWLTKAGAVHGRQTSQTMNRRWAIRQRRALAWQVGNSATYSPYVHAERQQARFHAIRGWVTDAAAIKAVVGSGRAKRIIIAALVARINKR